MKQYIFNLCLWISCLLIIISISSILIHNQKKLSNQIIYNCNKNNLPHSCGNNSLSESFEPYDGSYTNGFSVNNVLCSNLDISQSLNTTANINFYDTSQYSNKTDTNKTITISPDGSISGVNKLINDNITFSKNTTVTKDLNITGKDNIKINGTEIFKLIYPVGSIYISTNPTSPETLFGGTWEQIKGKFLYSTNNNPNNTNSDIGSTGGSENVTLNTNNLPSHNHSVNIKSSEMSGSTYAKFYNVFLRSGWVEGRLSTQHNEGSADGGGDRSHYQATINLSHTHNIKGNTGSVGGNKSFSILPPYYKVYMWKRTKL